MIAKSLFAKQGRELYIDAGKDLKIHKISKRVATHYLLRKIDLEMLPHLKITFFTVKVKKLGEKLVSKLILSYLLCVWTFWT